MTSTPSAWHRLLAPVALAVVLACAGCSGSESAADQLKAGQEALAKKRPRDAVVRFKAALQKDPGSAELRYLLGEALLQAGDPYGATVELGKALDQKYDDVKVIPSLARAMLLAGDVKRLTTLYDTVELPDRLAQASLKASLTAAWGQLNDRERAVKSLEASLRASPDLPTAQVLKARLDASEGHLDSALQTVESVLARDKSSAEAWHLKGELLTAKGAPEAAAREAFENSLAAEPAFLASHIALVTQHLKANDIKGARARVEKLRAVLPRHPQTTFLDARLALLDHDYPRAREMAQQLLRLAPDNTSVLQLAASVEGVMGSPVLAEAYYSKALTIDPSLPGARRSLAKIYLKLGQPGRSLSLLDPLVNANPPDTEALGVAGEAQLQLGDARSAEQLFLRAARTSPDDGRPKTALALIKLARGDAAGAFSDLEAISARAADTSADMAIVAARMKRGEFGEALKALEAVERKSPKQASTAEARGRAHAAAKDFAAARSDFEAALKLEPARFSAIASLAGIDIAEGKPAEARKRLEAAVKIDPRNHVARTTLAELMQQQGAPLQQVIDTLSAGIAAAPDEPLPRLRLIDTLLARRQFKEALAAAQEAVSALPNEPDVLEAVGRAQGAAGDTQQALSTFRRLASLDTKTARAQLRLAEAYGQAGDPASAITALRRALEIEPANAAAQAGLVDMLTKDGRPRDALEFARTMQAQSPRAPAGYLLEGAVHRRGNDLEPAIAAYRKGLAQIPASGDLAVELHKSLLAAKRTAEADQFSAERLKTQPDDLAFQLHAASVAIVRNDLDRAEALLTQLQAKLPTHPMVLNNLAWVLATRGKPGALGFAQKAVDLLPNRATLLDTLALALASERQYAKALEVQRKAIEIAPSDMGLRLNLAKIAIRAGDKALAKSELERLTAQGEKMAHHAEVARLLKSL